ncbi:DUF6390 family protein [Phytohabitans suffuscus]|uniref:Uncharacterized protein n=1 Tax=Phytohabitans suffuscus TaxID=624315 RepID=A0A6F8Z0I3_9ACTN|nr:DUF6390 family protein [Phytohabitans suffuscus]BCB91897.1 hypothetical protein Psuf_092100 [Phytohabitans suffuscus]
MSASGAVLFARYAYPPNALGYCGPAGAGALLRPDATAEIERRARRFEGAWTYLRVIAESAGIADPLDPRVVEAYWVGNELLGKVDPARLVDRLLDRFGGQPGGTWRQASGRAVAHHSFQVFEVYPWARLLRAGAGATAVEVLDRCRIRAGEVVRVDGPSATVRTRSLRWDGTALVAGPARESAARWCVDGMALIDEPRPGALVALHFDWVCDELTGDQATRLGELEAGVRAAMP